MIDCNLFDLGFVGEKYTWERCRGSNNWVQERLDRGLATKDWMDFFPATEVRVLEVSSSDHLPLFIYLNRQIYIHRERRFRFENAWIKESDCRNIVQECWGMRIEPNIMEKMVRVCAKLEEWGEAY